jgi:hypothetical protein
MDKKNNQDKSLQYWAVLLVACLILVGWYYNYTMTWGGSFTNVTNFPMNLGTSLASMEDFNTLQAGMSYSQVCDIVGDQGTEMSRSEIAGYQTIMYSWNGNGILGANMTAMFQNGKLVSKAQFGLGE